MNMKSGILILLCIMVISLLAIPLNAQDTNIPEKSNTLLYYVCEKVMPWGVALLIGATSVIATLLIGVVSVIVNLRLMKSNEKNIQAQMANARKITLAEFQATLGTKNRQEWINDLRTCISEYITQCSLIAVAKLSLSRDINASELGIGIDKITLSRLKIELFLNTQEASQNKLLEIIDNLSDAMKDENDLKGDAFRKARTEVINAATSLFQEHWTIIKESLKELKV